MNVLRAKSIFIAVFHKTFAGIDHKDGSTGFGFGFVDHNNAGGNTGTIEQVGRQSDNAFDITLMNNLATDFCFGISPEQHTMRQNHCTFTRTF